ncbi:hypothetical protein LSAT2_024716 [Lamellibrachia satsuma]|nr:hypothetical protein LSAT2_024716 [Lamellibrachia satsuma]
MGYKPTDQQPPSPAQGSGQKYYVRSVTETQRQDRDRVVMNGNVRQTEDDLEQYLSPVEDYNNYGLHSAENLPQVVRGSILIKNSIDTTGAPRVVDIVEENESDEVVVEDNVNPFHGHYFQSRENPMYSSDQDLSRIHRETTTKVYGQRQPPRHLVNMFDNTKKTTTTTTTKKKSRTVPRETGNDGFDREIKVTRGYGEGNSTKTTRTERTTSGHNGYDQTDYGRQTSSEFDISTLLRNAPMDSIKQSIKVDREEEEIIGPLPTGDGGDAEDLLNFDTVSEKVDLGLEGGNAVVSVKVRCVRIVPIRGAADMFKKSSVIVTRIIEIDLQATEERRRMYEHIMHRTASGNMLEQQAGGRRHRYEEAKLSTKDTFKLYKTFMGLAEADEGMQREKMTIDRTIEDERRPELYLRKNLAEAAVELMDYDAEGDFDTDELERRLEEELLPRYGPKPPEPDTISYTSHVSGHSDLLY